MLSRCSELRRKPLAYFYMNRLAHICRAVGERLGVRLDSSLARTGAARTARTSAVGNRRRQRYYHINRRYSYLKAIFSLLEATVGIVPAVRSTLDRVRLNRADW